MDAPEDKAGSEPGAEDAGAGGISGIGQTEFAAEPPPSEWLGRVIDGRYRVTALLGEGGMGAVYVAEHLALRKEVALKVVRAELAGNGEVATRFAREAMATAQFEHPHVASAIDYGTLPEGGAYFVMQLVRGRSLRALLRRQKRLPWRKACELLAQVADALSAARSAEIIHRDLKPDNILVEAREDGSDLVKVLDFGIAHVAPRDAPAPAGAQAHRELTRVGTVMGTPGYMSPEQAVGDKVDHRTDLYALGVVLWECLTGRDLWDAPDLTTVISRQMSEPVPRLREQVDDPTLPAELDELVQRLTARRADARPAHAGEVRDALRRLAASEDSRITFPDAVAQAQTYIRLAQGRFRRAQLRFKQRWPERKQQQLVLGAGVGGVLVLLLVLLSLGGGEPPTARGAAAGETQGETQDTPVLDKVVIAATNVVRPAVEAVTKPARSYPPEFKDDVESLLEGRSLRVRRNAAKKILAHESADDFAAYIRVIAEFETARGCDSRREVIDKMEEDPDARYLPALKRMRRARKTGCGFLSLQDCYACVRADLRSAIANIETETGTDHSPDDEGQGEPE